MDMDALTPENFYLLVATICRVESGDTIHFSNSTDNHMIKSVRSMWSDGTEPMDITQQEIHIIELTKPGVYGFCCTVHSQRSMIALVVVDTLEPNSAETKTARLDDRAKYSFAKLFVRSEKDRKAFGG